MFAGTCEHYFRTGLSAIRCIDEALAAANVREVRTILDMPSGYGRVLRFLVRRFPGAEVYASELQVDAVRFCADTFGAKPVFSSPDFDGLSLETRFDLIWCGSLVTHLDAAPTLGLLRFFARQLAPGGLLVFTTLGDYAAGRVLEAPASYAMPRERASQLADAYARSGHGYVDYPGVDGYGLTLTSPEWVRAVTRQAGGLREVCFSARGWHEHQDVFGFVRRRDSATM
ncbi:MAG TPA: class I SAM-dependent methyltransferase [Longimicrobium sp.]|jgi:SAM-dependent methyltransferase